MKVMFLWGIFANKSLSQYRHPSFTLLYFPSNLIDKNSDFFVKINLNASAIKAHTKTCGITCERRSLLLYDSRSSHHSQLQTGISLIEQTIADLMLIPDRNCSDLFVIESNMNI
jgi:hypothetical protein